RRRTYTPRRNDGGGVNMRQLRGEHENLLGEMREFDRWNSFINILVVVAWVCSIVLPNIKFLVGYVAPMECYQTVMGLCGETKISNIKTSWNIILRIILENPMNQYLV
ncbi:3216_t:CDS:2, partial [Funneliformis caledonium]